MLLLIAFSFFAGVVTVLSPCILPILPLILSSSLGREERGKARPLGVIVGFVMSFTLFTLFLSTLVSALHISADTLRMVAVVVIGIFGISLLVPQFQVLMEKIFSRLTGLAPRPTGRKGFGSGLLVGFSLGLLWTPCVGPILASVISLALTGSVTLVAFFITLAYAVGTALPMLLIMWGGRELLNRVPWLLRNTANIQKGFGVLMVLVAIAIFTNLDRSFQTFIVNTFPQYGAGLTKFEDRESIQKALRDLQNIPQDSSVEDKRGKPMFDLLPKGPQAPELIPGGVWINSSPLTLAALKGKVVVIDFWTYSCINCQRTLPYLKKWYEKYADKGLVIIGVHAPEFEFEKSEKNVRKAVEDFGLQYPIVQDNNFATWRAYENHYWPAKYFIDKDGYIRYSHFGEGAYEESERVLQELLQETGTTETGTVDLDQSEPVTARTPELYLGYDRLEYFSSQEPVRPDEIALYSAVQPINQNSVAYRGLWQVRNEYASPQQDASLLLNFEAKKVYVVMRPVGQQAKIAVTLDGKTETSGEDIQAGVLTVDEDRLYSIVSLPKAGEHLLELHFLEGAVEVYAFTFG